MRATAYGGELTKLACLLAGLVGCGTDQAPRAPLEVPDDPRTPDVSIEDKPTAMDDGPRLGSGMRVDGGTSLNDGPRLGSGTSLDGGTSLDSGTRSTGIAEAGLASGSVIDIAARLGNMETLCNQLSPDKVYVVGKIAGFDLSALYDVSAPNVPCGVIGNGVITSTGRVLYGALAEHVVWEHVLDVPQWRGPHWDYDYPYLSGPNRRIQAEPLDASTPPEVAWGTCIGSIFPAPDSPDVGVYCGSDRVFVTPDGKLQKLDWHMLARGRDGLFLTLAGEQDKRLTLYKNGQKQGTYSLPAGVGESIRVARSSADGFLIVTSQIKDSDYPEEHLLFMSATGSFEDRGAYAPPPARFLELFRDFGTEVALDASGNLYLVGRDHIESVFKNRGMVVKRAPGAEPVIVWEDPLPDSSSTVGDELRLQIAGGLITGHPRPLHGFYFQ